MTTVKNVLAVKNKQLLHLVKCTKERLVMYSQGVRIFMVFCIIWT